jgi:branched-chain amino acid transport system permease protein
MTRSDPRGIRRWLVPGAGLAAGVALAGLPWLGTGYLVRFATTLFMFMVLAQAWNLIGGLAGYPSFGNVAFFGIGAYATGTLMVRAGLPLAPSLALAALAGALFAVGLGLPVLRLRGHYFAVATFAAAEAMREIVNNLTDLTGGGMGLNFPLLRGGARAIGLYFYGLMLGLYLAALAVDALVRRSRLGYGLLAIREDEEAAMVAGVDATRYKIVAFALSAVLTALAGGIYGYWITFIDPSNVFDVLISVTMLVMVLLGGGGTLWGPPIGAATLMILTELVWSRFLQLHAAILGAAIILVVIFLPEGLLEVARQGRRAFTPANLLRNIRRYGV